MAKIIPRRRNQFGTIQIPGTSHTLSSVVVHELSEHDGTSKLTFSVRRDGMDVTSPATATLNQPLRGNIYEGDVVLLERNALGSRNDIDVTGIYRFTDTARQHPLYRSGQRN